MSAESLFIFLCRLVDLFGFSEIVLNLDVEFVSLIVQLRVG